MSTTGWERRPLRALCLPIEKIDPVETGRAEVRYVDIGSVDGSRHAIATVTTIKPSEAPSRCRQVIQSGDTLFSTVRPYLEKIALVDEPLDGQFASTGFAVLRPGPDVEPRFLFYFALSAEMMQQVLPRQHGVSYPAVLDKQVREAVMPVPPREEQRRIIEILEDHLSRLDAAEAYVDACQHRADKWHAGCLSREVWRAQFPRAVVGDLLREPMRNGRSDRAAKEGESGTRTLTLTAVTENEFSDANTKLTVTPPGTCCRSLARTWRRAGPARQHR